MAPCRSFSFDDLDDLVSGASRKARGHREGFGAQMAPGTPDAVSRKPRGMPRTLDPRAAPHQGGPPAAYQHRQIPPNQMRYYLASLASTYLAYPAQIDATSWLAKEGASLDIGDINSCMKVSLPWHFLISLAAVSCLRLVNNLVSFSVCLVYEIHIYTWTLRGLSAWRCSQQCNTEVLPLASLITILRKSSSRANTWCQPYEEVLRV